MNALLISAPFLDGVRSRDTGTHVVWMMSRSDVGSILIGAAGVGTDIGGSGPIGATATIGMCTVLFGIHGIRTRYKLPRAQLRRTR